MTLRGRSDSQVAERDQLAAMLDRAGIPFESDSPESISVMKDGRSEKVEGYLGFMVVFSFAPDGSLDHLEIWE